METEGGGWEVFWKQAGGPLRPNPNDSVGNYRLMTDASTRSDPVVPPLNVRVCVCLIKWCLRSTCVFVCA